MLLKELYNIPTIVIIYRKAFLKSNR